MSSEVGDLIQSIVEEIVDHPDDVNVNETTDDRTTTLEISANKELVGKVIGKQVSMAKALRTICSAISGKRDHRFMVLIKE